jgi:hypothetical protein
VFGDLAIVTFYSDSSVQGKGFLMSYEALFTNGSASRIDFSTNMILSETPEDYFSYPGPGESYYKNNELSTFVYSPEYSYDPSFTTQAYYRMQALGPGGICFDFVTVYRFQPVVNATGRGWSFVNK